MELQLKEAVDQSLAIANNYFSTDRPNKAVELLSVVKKLAPEDKNLNYLQNYLVNVMMGRKSNSNPFFGEKWSGQSLDGKSIEIFCDQGMGDTIQMLRYIKELKNQWDCHIFVNCYAFYYKFAELFESIDYVDVFTNKHFKCDYHTNALTLPAILNGIEEGLTYPPRFREIMKHTIPDQPLIESNKDCPVHLLPKLKIGIAWESNKDNELSVKKSIPVHMFAPFAACGHLYSLIPQQTDLVDQDFTVETLADTAAIIKEMDVIVSVDTAVLHLAGSMRKLTIGLIDLDGDPRWSCEGQSIWYPYVMLIKQTEMHNWDQPIRNAVDLIKEFR